MRIVKNLLLLMFIYSIFALAVYSGFGVTEASNIDLPQVLGTNNQNTEITEDSRTLIAKINSIRDGKGLPILSANIDLQEVANYRSSDMITNDYYSHIQPNGKDYYSLFTERKSFSCENLNMTTYSDMDEIINDWLTSDKGHRECLLDLRANNIGITIEEYEINGQKTYLSVAILSS